MKGTSMISFLRVCAALSFAALVMSAQVVDLSGTWQLDVQKSSWGKHPKPTAATVIIEHHEPKFKYQGTSEFENGTETSDGKKSFAFDGAIDGKTYPISGSNGPSTMTIRRTNPTTTVSEMKSAGGVTVETAKTTISGDGKQLTRELKASGPNGVTSWTEVYIRR
jgi:hypothetical protein